MSLRVVEDRRSERLEAEVLEALTRSDTPAIATDTAGHVLFWNPAAERLLDRPSREVLGRRCYDVVAGRDVFGNRFCHENCAVFSMTRKGETVHGFEIVLSSPPKPEQALNVTIMKVPDRDQFILVHLLQPIDRAGRLSRELERLGAPPPFNGASSAGMSTRGPGLPAAPPAPPLTDREREVLRWVAAGEPNKEIAKRLDISLATVRNHIHHILEKLDVHSKLEAVSLAFRQGWVQVASGMPARNELPGNGNGNGYGSSKSATTGR
jgi:DNA-binding CsgD family transcriptional regulator